MNHITIAGRLDDDPIRKEANNSVVCSFRIASGRSGSKSGRLWIDIDTWGRLAGVCYQHLAKGRRVLVAGRLTQKQWADPATGEKRTRYLITATNVDFLQTHGDSSQSAARPTVVACSLRSGVARREHPHRRAHRAQRGGHRLAPRDQAARSVRLVR